MDFQKKMKIRKIISVSYIAAGLILVIANIGNSVENNFNFAFGFALLAMGILRLLCNRKITASEQSMRKQELAEADERIRMISERAKSWAFILSIIGSGVLVIVLNVLGYREQALPFSWYVCAMATLYWICWVVIQKKY